MGISEIEDAALKLPFDQLQALAARIDEAVAARVDADLEQAVNSGIFDRLADQALKEHRAGTTRPLDDLLNER